MKPLKFRLWSVHEKKMSSVANISFGGDGSALTIVVSPAPYDGTAHNDKVDGEGGHLMQFIGLLDKNNTEIYEGDIVKYTRYNWYRSGHLSNGKDLISYCEIYYNDEHKGFRERGNFKDGGGWSGNCEFDDSRVDKIDLEVLGNIYENPELLKLKS